MFSTISRLLSYQAEGLIYGLLNSILTPRRFIKLGMGALSLAGITRGEYRKSLIIDTDIFSDVDDAGALLLASTLKAVDLLAVNVNVPSSYSVLAASAILAHYGHPNVPIGIRRPVTNDTFLDTQTYELGEYTSKVAYHWSNGTLAWGNAERAWDPVQLYRKTLADKEDRSLTIVSIGFFENLYGLLTSTADDYSPLSGPELIAAKVSELVVMGGGYPTGYEYNFHGSNATLAAHVVNNWEGRITFSGFELGKNVISGARFSVEGPANDPVRAAYRWHSGCNASRYSWDPLTVLYASHGLGNMFEYGNKYGYNHVFPNGSNEWVHDGSKTNQHWLRLKVDNETAGRELDNLFLEGANSFGQWNWS